MKVESGNVWIAEPSKGRAFEFQKFLVGRALGQIVSSTISTYLPMDGSILEVGAGTGYGKHMMPPEFKGQYLSTDINIENLRIGESRYGTTVIPADASRLPFRDCLLSGVIAQDTFDILPDLESAFTEFHRVLKPGGHIIHFATVYPSSEILGMPLKKPDTHVALKMYEEKMREASQKTGLEVVASDLRTAELISHTNDLQKSVGANTFIQAVGKTVALFDKNLEQMSPQSSRESSMAFVFVARKN